MSDTVWHPAWCDQTRCYVNDDTGMRVHAQAPTVWEQADTRFSLGLIRAEDEPCVLLVLEVSSTLPTGETVHAILPVPAARKLGYRIEQHLATATTMTDVDKIGAAMETLMHSGVVQDGRARDKIEAAVTAALDAAGALI